MFIVWNENSYNSFGQLYSSRGREKSNIVESGK